MVYQKIISKQFSPLLSKHSLFRASLRFRKNDRIDFEKQHSLTNSDYRFLVTEQLQNCIDPTNFIELILKYCPPILQLLPKREDENAII